MRMNAPKELFTENSLVRLKDNNWLEKQRVAGRIAAETLLLLADAVKTGKQLNLNQLNQMGEDYITKHKDSTCTFKGYRGFPAGVCISVNKELVHGIPKDYDLKDGDLVSFDLGVTYHGAIADTALTVLVGEPDIATGKKWKLLDATYQSLMAGIHTIKVGSHLGVIGEAIWKSAKPSGFNIINNYGGHGLDWDVPHAPPFVENKSDSTKGIRIQPGLAIAIEPMLVLGSTNTTTLDDGWTVVTPDLSAHFEHSVFVHEDHVEIITDRTKL